MSSVLADQGNRFQERIHEELERRNDSGSAIWSYLRIVDQFQDYCGKRLDRFGPDDLRRYHTYLLEGRKLAVEPRFAIFTSRAPEDIVTVLAKMF
ncbi:MAG: hypothetical protein ACR2JB_00315 [Bryobacteraceae bacterium]